jgi:glycosyltransferase involved in cell wall biosynthesis
MIGRALRVFRDETRKTGVGGAVRRLAAAVQRRVGGWNLTRMRRDVNELQMWREEHTRQLRIHLMMQWIAQATLQTAPLISVVMPTRNRANFLPRAIASVHAQTYANWELLIVDDASVDGTAQYIAGLHDPRIRTWAGAGTGPCAARNVALAQARGSIVAYLDDDNVMHPQWLKSVAWLFEQRPEVDVMYGAFAIDDVSRIHSPGNGTLPRLIFRPYDEAKMRVYNVTDMSCTAHRAGLPEARFDESLLAYGDWDLLLRLTRGQAPFALPVLACFYMTDSPNRLSTLETYGRDLDKVRAKFETSK